MKYTNLIIGLILFSGVMFVMFMAAAEIGKDYGSKDHAVYSELSNNYINNTELGTEENGTLRKISSKLDEAEFSVVSAAVGAIDAVLQGAKLMKDSIETTGNIAERVAEDSQGRIHPIIPKIIKSVISVLVIIILLILFIKMKPET